jgi:5-carboxymethyl-2-hydroxymuconate isomerase
LHVSFQYTAKFFFSAGSKMNRARCNSLNVICHSIGGTFLLCPGEMKSVFNNSGENQMPQIILEYTSNLPAPDEKPLFLSIHRILQNVAGISIENCKSRILRHDLFLIGEGEADRAFIHLQVRFLEGRTDEVKEDVGRRLLSLLESYFRTGSECRLQISVELGDIKRAAYFKHS